MNEYGEASLMTVAAFVARLERERDAIDEAIRLMRSVARLLDTRAPAAEHPESPPHTKSPGGGVYNWVEARVRFERDGLGTSELARLLGCSKQSIDWHRKKEGWKRPALNGNGAHA